MGHETIFLARFLPSDNLYSPTGDLKKSDRQMDDVATARGEAKWKEEAESLVSPQVQLKSSSSLGVSAASSLGRPDSAASVSPR